MSLETPIAERLLVMVESPYAGDTERNLAYARRAMRDSILRGELPNAGHLLYTQPGILDDNNSVERELGIQAGYRWGLKSAMIVFYTDYGWSRGMRQAFDFYDGRVPIIKRTIGTEEEHAAAMHTATK